MNIHIETVGQGPDLVMLHGWGLDSDVFEPLRAPLSRHYRLHVVDLPGYGRSRECEPPETTADLAARLLGSTPPGAAWFGWSLGAQVALFAARQAPARVRRLILTAATPCFVARAGWPAAMPPPVFEEFLTGLQHDRRGTLERFLGLLPADPRRERGMLRELRGRLDAHGEPSRTALARGLAWLRDNDLRAFLSALDVPIRWIHGERDRLVPSDVSAAVAALRPRDRLIRMADAGHAPFLSSPDEFLAHVETFLAEAA